MIMTVMICMLRGVNVGGHHKLKMEVLRHLSLIKMHHAANAATKRQRGLSGAQQRHIATVEADCQCN